MANREDGIEINPRQRDLLLLHQLQGGGQHRHHLEMDDQAQQIRGRMVVSNSVELIFRAKMIIFN